MSESPRSNNSKVNATDVDVNSTKTSGVALDLKANSVDEGVGLKVSATSLTTGSAVEITGVATKTALNVVTGNTTLGGALEAAVDPFVEKTKAVAVGTDAVTAANGDVLVISATGPGDITLPAAKAGSKIRMLFKLGNTTAFTITAPGASAARYDVLSAITLEDKATDTANTFADIPETADNTLTITAAGIGSHLEFINDGTTYFVMGHLAPINGTPASANFSTVP